MVILLVGSATALMDGQEMTALARLLPALKVLMVDNVVGVDHVCVASVCVTNQTPHTLV